MTTQMTTARTVTGLASGVSSSAGTAIHGGASAETCRMRPDLCGDHKHPGVTYNPWHDVTACLCGLRWQEGNQVQWPKADGIDGPLREVTR